MAGPVGSVEGDDRWEARNHLALGANPGHSLQGRYSGWMLTIHMGSESARAYVPVPTLQK